MSTGQVVVVVLAFAVVAWAVIWFARGHGPFDEEGVEAPAARAGDGHPTEAGHFDPADAAAEPQVGPTNRLDEPPLPR